ncbi:hypothetical protein EDD15DRAFT_2193613 [Pisolithus albus]|nr:hypothetical protein EDD15DRAFT_2193613 [Pisolithus albus]
MIVVTEYSSGVLQGIADDDVRDEVAFGKVRGREDAVTSQTHIILHNIHICGTRWRVTEVTCPMYVHCEESEGLAGLWALPPELFQSIFSYLDMHGLVMFVEAFPFMSRTASHFVHSRLHGMIGEMVPDSERLLHLLDVHDAVLGGSTVLRFIFGNRCADWVPSTLDIYVGATNAYSLKCSLEEDGFEEQRGQENPYNPSSTTQIHAVLQKIHALLSEGR